MLASKLSRSRFGDEEFIKLMVEEFEKKVGILNQFRAYIDFEYLAD